MPKKPKSNYTPKPGKIAGQDVFQTPPYALQPLLPYIIARGYRRVRESAVGKGYLACWLHQQGLYVIGTDLDTGHDRFAADWSLAGADFECTNVPFSLKYQWIARACQQGHDFALLMPADVIYAAARFWPNWDQYQLQVLVPDKRIDYKPPTGTWESSSAQMHTAWVTRGLGLPAAYNRCYLEKPGKRRLAELAPQWESAWATYMQSLATDPLALDPLILDIPPRLAAPAMQQGLLI